MEGPGIYHQALKPGADAVDEQTWQDLGLEDIFALIDRTASPAGKQVLYHRLRTYVGDDAVLAQRVRAQERFRKDTALREQCLKILRRLGARTEDWLVLALVTPPAPIPGFAPLLYLCAALSFASIVATPFNHVFIVPAMAFALVNMAISGTYGRRIRPFFTGFSQVVTLLGIAEQFGRLPAVDDLPELATLRNLMPKVRGLRRKLGWLAVDRASLPDLIGSLLEYLNLIFLFDILVYLRSVAALRQHQKDLIEVFDAVGSIDSTVAIASYLNDLRASARPMLADDRTLEAAGLYHPQLAEPVPNDVSLQSRSALVSGPNMAGKTVFVRTLGVNVILGQTLGFCFADRATLPRARVRSAIRREDSVVDGKSYFFTEVEQILGFTHLGERPLHLLLLDEIYRGTNTVERVAASVAVLRHLSLHHLVVATTHDVELQTLLADTYEMFHFSDRVVDGRYGFDYLLQQGPVRSRNAIRLLEIAGYPPEVIREAEALARGPGQ